MPKAPSAWEKIQKARRLQPGEQLQEFYREWADTYDSDIEGAIKFIGADRVASLLARHLPDRSKRVVDLGCGTGLVGRELRDLGYEHIDGMDISPEMLKVATTKNIYNNTTVADLLSALPIPDATYDAAISAGTFTSGHVDARALPEIRRIIKPGGCLACVIADAFWTSGGFAEAFASTEFDIVHFSHGPIVEDGSPDGRYLVVRV